ncbi:flagellar protein [Celeribacter ethanolicus]|uniref:Flagellar protein n=1 Tax=Celeribacter ethanolicus TaxID=1758178 RepID=A0A291GEJ8_9RHOB|nr:DUF1217 domain-containing protein [Celeribacter ethanolicus]ATG48446.1 flagellar protein [Celeribacter ethanolicus]TNE64110.1 MAG: DUF1217 domain-containing protein [Paracoccaceae bacterium]
MTYQPVIPFSGYAGWVVLQKTQATQQEAFNKSAEIQRDTDYFRNNIANVRNAEELVSDYRLLKVALGAFGLDDDINSKFFVEKVLSEGTLDDKAIANKLTDKRYFKLAEAFGFGNFDTPNTVLSDFPDEIISAYQEKQFQIAVGDQDEGMRLALNLEDDLMGLVDKDTTDNGRWYSVMGNEALRTVFETALGLPSSVSSLDLDQQLTIFRDKAEQYFHVSEVSQFSDPKKREDLVKLFLIRSELNSGPTGTSAASNALALLTGSF